MVIRVSCRPWGIKNLVEFRSGSGAQLILLRHVAIRRESPDCRFQFEDLPATGLPSAGSGVTWLTRRGSSGDVEPQLDKLRRFLQPGFERDKRIVLELNSRMRTAGEVRPSA
jgi:hypothetical protein